MQITTIDSIFHREICHNNFDKFLITDRDLK